MEELQNQTTQKRDDSKSERSEQKDNPEHVLAFRQVALNHSLSDKRDKTSSDVPIQKKGSDESLIEADEPNSVSQNIEVTNIRIIYEDENGRRQVTFYNPNMKIEGPEFLKNTILNLHKIYATVDGKTVIDALMDTKEGILFDIKEASYLLGVQYDFNKNILSYDDNPWKPTVGGGAYDGMVGLGHELYHTYQDLFNKYPSDSTKEKRLEEGAVEFGNYLRSVYDLGEMRNRYLSHGIIYWDFSEERFNPEMEKISNFGYNYITEDYEGTAKGVDRENIPRPDMPAVGQELNYQKSFGNSDKKTAFNKKLN